jgi:hypothetical protein
LTSSGCLLDVTIQGIPFMGLSSLSEYHVNALTSTLVR